jgi:DNA-binding SARP family transcriptional activator
MTLHITLLKEVSIRKTALPHTDRRTLPGQQAGAAFAHLVMAGERGLTQDELADTVWGDELPATWAPALRGIVSRVRAFVAQAVGAGTDPDLLSGRHRRYVLRLPPDTVVDLHEAQRAIDEVERILAGAADAVPLGDELAAAVAATTQLRAPFLPGCDAEWIDAQRRQLAELRQRGLEISSDAASRSGDGDVAVRLALEAVATGPRRKSAHRRLMDAYRMVGNRAEALRVYQRLRRLLSEEIGVEPDRETERAYLRLLGAPDRCGAGERDRGARHPEPPFVGRERELAAAGDAWADTRRGRTRLLVVEGGAGTGKTRLVRELADRLVTDGARVVFARCDPDAARPYQPLVDVLESLAASLPGDQVAGSDFGSSDAGARLMATAAGTRATDESRLFDQAERLLATVTRGTPVLIVVDEAEALDRHSGALVRHLLRRLPGRPLLFTMVGEGGGAPTHPLFVTTRAADRAGVLAQVQLSGLDNREVRSLIAGLTDRRDLLAGAPRLVAETAGNPKMLVELLWRALETPDRPIERPSGAPPALRALVAAGQAHLDAPARTLLRAAAVVGGRFDAAVAARAAGLHGPVVDDALDALVAAGILTPVGDGPINGHRFRAEAERAAVLSGLPASECRRLHRNVATELERRAREEPGSVAVADIARHHGAAGRGATAARAALAAAAEAGHRGDVHGALGWSERARELSAGAGSVELAVEVELAAGRALHALGERRATDALLAAVTLALGAGRWADAATGALSLAELAEQRPEARGEARALVSEVLATVPPVDGDGATPLWWARLVAREVAVTGPGAGQDETRRAVNLLTGALAQRTGPCVIGERTTLAGELAALAASSGDRDAARVARHHQAMAAGFGHPDDAPVWSCWTAEDKTGPAAPGGSASPAGLDGEVAVAVTRGRFAEAYRLARGAGGYVPHQLLVARWLTAELPGPGATERQAARCLLADPEELLSMLAAGERGRARVTAYRLVAGIPGLPVDDEYLHVMALLSLAVVELRDGHLARAVHDVLRRYAGLHCGVGYRTAVAPVTFHLGRLAAVMGDRYEAERQLNRALRDLVHRGARPWVALTQLALADVLADGERASEAAVARTMRAEADAVIGKLGLRREPVCPV